jgi:ferrous iron transport protein B
MGHDAVRSSTVVSPDSKRKIVLVGNPNSGKSVLFNALTGLYVDVSNYPGTTLDISSSEIEQGLLIDTPGVYGISSFNDEERIARDIILTADVVINVVNSMYLERDLFLTQQIIDAGIPMVVALNMMDEAEKRGMAIDAQRLSRLLGVPVVPTVAVRKIGISEILERVTDASIGHQTPGLDKLLESVDELLGKRAGAVDGTRPSPSISTGRKLLLLEGDREIADRESIPPAGHREVVYRMRRKHVNSIVSQVLLDRSKSTLGEIIGKLSIRPLTGIPMLIGCMWVVYKVMGSLVASTIVGFTEETVMAGLYEPWMRSLVSRIIPSTSVVWDILVGEFGVLTMTPVYVFGLLTPLVLGFYLFISLFEDSGYLPRIAALSDRTFGSIGLNGKAIIPIILGFGCTTMATITTRMLGTQKEKRIATFLLGLAIPCSAQLGVISAMLSKLGVGYLALYILTIIMVFLAVGALLKAILPGGPSSLLLDLPPMRIPSLSNVMRKAVTRTVHFIKEATPLFAAGSVLIGAMNASGVLDAVQRAAQPIVVSWLRLPRETATSFIMGFIRRDFGAAGLTSIDMTGPQVLTAMVTMSLFVPCIASVLVMMKERGRLEAAAMWVGAFTIALVTGGLVSRVLSLV